ncbi:hypothetical protein T10_4673 [Trichinella papuae]|uniref:Uncharacterized protein n=1 Tax=Trichinella papuae TaxID=268474 RepID=A0A0V1NAP5_9BILA|nr:hypothetical protein T10_4673 [Trichinella papuae]
MGTQCLNESLLRDICVRDYDRRPRPPQIQPTPTRAAKVKKLLIHRDQMDPKENHDYLGLHFTQPPDNENLRKKKEQSDKMKREQILRQEVKNCKRPCGWHPQMLKNICKKDRRWRKATPSVQMSVARHTTSSLILR